MIHRTIRVTPSYIPSEAKVDHLLIVEELKDYMSKKRLAAKIKNARLYLEVRYARDISLCIPKTSDIFEKDYKNLSSE